MMLYSSSTNGFYHPMVHGNNIPADAVEITDARYAELLDGQSAGQIITAGGDGAPTLQSQPSLSIDAVRAQAGLAMSDWIAQFLAQFTTGVPAAELASWPVKADRARQHLAGKAQAMIAAEAALTGEDATALAQKIAAKADAYEAIIARVTGLRRATEAAIAEAETPEAVAEALEASKDKATAIAASLGVGAG